MSTSTAENDLYSVENWDTEALISFLKERNIKLDEDDFKILRKRKINGQSFLLMNEEKLERCGLEMGPALLLAEVIKVLKDNNRKHLSSSHHSLTEVLAKFNIDDNGIGTVRQFSQNDNRELQQCVGETKSNTSEQETNDIGSTISLSSRSTQTMNISADKKSLTYLIQGLISRSLRHFDIDVGLISIGGKTEGVCKISSVDKKLSSVSLYCEYELGNSYIYQPNFIGYPIVIKSPFSPIGTIVTGLNESKEKFIDNPNYTIEFFEMSELEELTKSSLNISDPSTGKGEGQTSAVLQTKEVATQTKPCVEDKKILTYIAKGIMFRSICWFTWNEHEAFILGKKEGKLRLVSSDPKLRQLTEITLTCYYKLSNCILSFQGDLGYPMIVSCSYGSTKTILTLDKKKILDNWNYDLTFIS